MLTYSYIDKNTGNEITNIYNGYAASAIRDTMKKFTPSSQKKSYPRNVRIILHQLMLICVLTRIKLTMMCIKLHFSLLDKII